MSTVVNFDFTVGQVGARIVLAIVRTNPFTGVTAALDVSSETRKDIIIKKPDGTKETFSGGGVVFTPAPDGIGDGTDGLIEASVLVDTTLDQEGTYEVQADMALPGEVGFTQIGTFTVGENL